MWIRTVVTRDSLWTFDLDAKMYLRVPRDEDNPGHPAVAYTGVWEPFDDLLEPEEGESENRLLVVRPVPYGTGRLRMTGDVISDETVEVPDDMRAA